MNNLRDVCEMADSGVALEEILKVAKKKTKEQRDELVDALHYAGRWSDLKKLAKNRLYKERAENELRIHKMIEDGHKAFEKQVAKYPPKIMRMHKIMQMATCDMGNYAVNWPSARLGSSHLTIMGDGMYMFMLEIVSLHGKGCFRLAKRRFDPRFDAPRPDGEFYESRSLIQFKELTGDYGTELTSAQVEAVLKTVFRSAANPEERLEGLRNLCKPKPQELTHAPKVGSGPDDLDDDLLIPNAEADKLRAALDGCDFRDDKERAKDKKKPTKAQQKNDAVVNKLGKKVFKAVKGM